MNKAEIKAYQKAIKPWSEDAEFESYELLSIEEFNDMFARFGADLFYKFYDSAEVTAKEIITNLENGEYGK
jgi:hypothetical protein